MEGIATVLALLLFYLPARPLSASATVQSLAEDKVTKIWDMASAVSVIIDAKGTLDAKTVDQSSATPYADEAYQPSAVYWTKITFELPDDQSILMHSGNSYFNSFIAKQGQIEKLEPDRFGALHLPGGTYTLIIRSFYPNKPFHSLTWMHERYWSTFYFQYLIESTAFRTVIFGFALYNLAQFFFGFRFQYVWYAMNQLIYLAGLEGVNSYASIILQRQGPLEMYQIFFLAHTASSMLYGISILGWKNIPRWMIYSLAACFSALVPILAFSYNISMLAPATLLICAMLLLIVWRTTLKVGGHRYYAAIGWTLMIMAYSIFSAHDIGWVQHYNEFTGYWLMAAESCFFSLAMGKAKQDRMLYLFRQVQLGLKESESLRQFLAESNVQLERKVEERTRDIQGILRNVRQGIFQVMDANFQVGAYYSPFLREILGMDDDSVDHPCAVFFRTLDLYHSHGLPLEGVLHAIIGHDAIGFELNQAHLPRQAVIHSAEQKKWVELSWDPVVNEDNTVDQIIVSVRDVSDVKRLETETGKMQEQLDILISLVQAKRPTVSLFFRRWQNFIKEQVSHGFNDQKSQFETLLLHLHTFKGSARSLGLRALAAQIHDKEDILTNGHEFAPSVQQMWDQVVGPLDGSFQSIINLCEEHLGWRLHNHVTEIDSDHFTQFLRIMRKDPADPIVRKMLHDFSACVFTSLSECLEELMAEAVSLAHRLKKPVPIITIDVAELLLDDRACSLLHAIWPHLLSNAMDHGIESEEERIAAGKPAAGSLTVLAQANSPHVIYFFDDGRGLDLLNLAATEAGQTLARNLKRPITAKETTDLILLSGTSTKQSVSDISGRGVGVAVVKKILEDAGGSLEVQLLEDSESGSSHCPFRYCLSLPAECFFAQESEPEAS